MPQVRNTATGQVTVVPDEVAADLVRGGGFELAAGDVEARSVTGGTVRVDGGRLRRDASLTPTTTREQAATVRGVRQERDYGDGLVNKAKALGEGVLHGATLGLATPLLDDEASRWRRENSALFTAGDVGGMLGAALLSGGAGLGGAGVARGGGGIAQAIIRATPAGQLARAGGRVAAGGGIGRAAAGAALEGAVGNAGYYLSDVALGDRKLSAEGFVGALGQGAFWGGGAGAAFAGLERGFVRARRLFPRVAGQVKAKDAAKVAERELDAKLDGALQAHEEAIAAARAKLDAARARFAEVGRQRGELDVQIARERLALDQARRAAPAERSIPADQPGEAVGAVEAPIVAAREADLPITVPPAATAPEPTPAAVDASAPAGPPPTPAADAWTPAALDDSTRLADMLGQSSVPKAPPPARTTPARKAPAARPGHAAALKRIEADIGAARERGAREVAQLEDDLAKVRARVEAARAAPPPPPEPARPRIGGIHGKGANEQVAARLEERLGKARAQLERARASAARAADAPRPATAAFADEVIAALDRVPDTGRFGSKTFVASVWEDLSARGAFSGSLDDFHRQLARAHREGTLELSRADLTAAMDPDRVARSEVKDVDSGARFHFVERTQRSSPSSIVESAERTVADLERELERVRGAAAPAASPAAPAVDEADLAEMAELERRLADARRASEREVADLERALNEARGPAEPGGLAEGSGEIEIAKLERAVADAEQARDSVRAWITGLRQKAGPRAALAPGQDVYSHNWRARTSKWINEAGEEVDQVSLPDERLAWRRPSPGSADEAADLYEDYDDLVRRAAETDDAAARDALLRDAADLDAQAWDASPAKLRDETLAARERTGLDAYTLATRRMERWREKLARGIKPADELPLGTPKRRPAEPIAAESTFGGVMEAANARLARFGIAAPGAAPPPGQFVADAEEAVAALGAFDLANAQLVEALGADAPPAAKALADEHAEAIAEHTRRATERAAQLADAVAETPITPRDVQERLAALKTRKLELGVEQVEARQAVKAAAGEVRSLRPPRAAKGSRPQAGEPAPGSAAAEPGLGARALDGATMLEALQTAGVAVPDVDRIPVIGPILGLFLKVRAAKALLWRGGGKVPATAEASIAAKAAGTRDKVASSVDRMLGLGAGAARVGRRAAGLAAARTVALQGRLYDDGEKRPAPKDDVEAVRHRVAELAAAQGDPNRVRRQVRLQLRGALDPDIVRAVEETMLRKLAYLGAHMPKEPPPSLLGRRQWRPSAVEIDRFARRVRAAEDPASVFDDLARGAITPEAAETLREVYPQLYAEAQLRLIERSAEIAEELPYQHVVRLGILFRAPLVPSLRPERLAAYQAANQAPPPTPASAAGSASRSAPDLGGLFETAAHRRARRP